MMIMPALFVVFAEHLGHLFVTSDIVGRDLIKDPGLHRSLFADGLSNMIPGLPVPRQIPLTVKIWASWL